MSLNLFDYIILETMWNTLKHLHKNFIVSVYLQLYTHKS